MALSPEKLRTIFLDEAEELLQSMEQSLIDLDSHPNNPDVLQTLFRAVHTIKGSAAMVGFSHLSAFFHEAENVLSRLRQGEITLSPEIISLFFACHDVAVEMVESGNDDIPDIADKTASIIEKLRAFTDSSLVRMPEKEQAAEKTDSEMRYIRIVMRFKPDVFLSGTDPIMLLMELNEIGHFQSLVCNTDAVPPLDEIAFDSCYLSWEGVFVTERSLSELDKVFIFVKDEHPIHFEDISSHFVDGVDIRYADKKLGEILEDEGIVDTADLASVTESHKKTGELLVEHDKVKKDVIDRIVKQQQRSKEIRHATTIRIHTDKLDSLIDTSGELVIAVSNLAQMASEHNLPHEFLRIVEKLQRISDDLQSQVMKVRMVPVETIFRPFGRLIRDTARTLGKEVTLTISGSDTELDKNINEGLAGPLAHLIRNAVDHGIEAPQERVRAGKPAEGSIWLRAFQQKRYIVIEIEDDGRGIDKDAVAKKAKELGMLKSDDLHDSELYAFIMAPGFSTAKEVSEISGRGVGLDVVRKSIEALRGSIEIYSEQGVGTLFRIKLPLTLAVIDGMLITVGDQVVTMPMLSIVEAFYLKEGMLHTIEGGGELLRYDGNYIPFVRLYDFLGFSSSVTNPYDGVILILEGHNRLIAVMADSVIGQQQAVIKSFADNYRDVDSISGATILGDGTISLIVDVHGIEKRVVHGRGDV